ncbi:MAG: thermonuclease family protein [Thermoleophilia bacterium]|nr:thermonuclease family protein [Thermoleophilia bacterium]
MAGFSRSPGLLLTVLVLLAGAVGCSSTSPASSPATTTTAVGQSATVAHVSDGDTLRTTGGRKIRLVQIDAPELHGDCYGKAALVALRTLAPSGTRITLLRDAALDATDRYGRQLRYAFVDGTNVNLALVRQGAASPYFFRGDRGRFARDLLAAVGEAQRANRGYWGACSGARLDTDRGSITGSG